MTVDERRSGQKTVLDTKGRPSKRDLKTVFNEGNTENQSVCCFNEQKLLLLEKAEIFRRQNREKWEIRELERRIAHEQLLGIYKTHSKLEEYHAQQKKRAFEKRTREEQKENEARCITAELRFGTNEQARLAARRFSLLPSSPAKNKTGPSVCIKKKKQSCDPQSDLTLSVIKGKNLFNHMQDYERRIEKCHLSVSICPDEESSPMTSLHRYVTPQGSTRWDHDFCFTGFSFEDFNSRYIKIVVSGQISNQKQFIGQAVIAGRGALVRANGHQPRPSKMSETIHLEKAMNTPGVPVSVTIPLLRKDWKEVGTAPEQNGAKCDQSAAGFVNTNSHSKEEDKVKEIPVQSAPINNTLLSSQQSSGSFTTTKSFGKEDLANKDLTEDRESSRALETCHKLKDGDGFDLPETNGLLGEDKPENNKKEKHFLNPDVNLLRRNSTRRKKKT